MKLRNKKTGEIVETDYKLGVSIPADSFMGCKSYDQIAEYNSLAEFNEEWEDYGAAEPLIKDEKIRKAVRAWAEACDIEKVYCKVETEEGSTFCIYTFQIDVYFIQFATHDQDPIGGGRCYTITELCGEEEE